MDNSKVFVINKFPFQGGYIYRLGFFQKQDQLRNKIISNGHSSWIITGFVLSVNSPKLDKSEFYENISNEIYDCTIKPINSNVYPEIGENLEVLKENYL